jgi:hypothetical protein
VRPLFFAGQLLTEEDLELLGEYVTAKNRLHNRHFLGEGVVCGLEVACHPCGEGKVLVRPGYALDCCGNDIVVPCETELDINALVHRLRIEELGGWDCGDPCDQPGKQTPAIAPTSKSGNGNGRSDPYGRLTGDDTEGEAPPVPRRYSLYVRYNEELGDPVAPYATDEPCGDEGCKPSRVREGYSFRLRCPEDPSEPDDFYARASKCYEAITRLRGFGKRQSLWATLGARIPSALRQYSSAATDFTESDAQAMVKSSAALREFAAREDEEPEPDVVRRRLDDLRAVVMASSRLYALPEEERRVAFERYGDLAAAAEGAPEAARLAAEAIGPHVDKSVDDEVERVMANALVTEGPQFTDRDTVVAARESVALYMAMEGTPVNVSVVQSYERSIAEMKEWLLARLDSASLTDCALRRDVERISVAPPSEGEVKGQRLGLASEAGQLLLAALMRYVYGCICGSILPPCRPCDDMDVLLATIEVEECEVAYVCNIERRIPLTGNTLAYWLPVEHLFQWLDKWCCEEPRKLADYKPLRAPVGQPVEQPTEIHELKEASGTLYEYQPRNMPLYIRTTEERRELASMASMLRAAGLPPEQTERIAKTISDVSSLREAGRIVPAPAAPAAVDPEAAAKAEAEREREVADIAASAAAEAVERVADRRLERVESRLKEFTEVKREVTMLRKRSDAQKERNADLEKRNRALEKRVEKLGGGG